PPDAEHAFPGSGYTQGVRLAARTRSDLGVARHPVRACGLHGRSRRRDAMIRKLKSGEYRLYSKKKNQKTGKRKNLGTFGTREAAEKHERAVQYFKRHG